MQSPISTGIIGFGASGKYFHAPFIHAHPGYNLSAVVERSNNEAVKIYPEIRTLRSADELFNDPGIELVVITTPNDTHFDLAYAALQAGKHVIVEKPFTSTTFEASELIRIGRLKNKLVSVYQSRRFESDYLTVKEIIRSGKIGEIVEFESFFDRYRPNPNPKTWKETSRPGIGLLYDLGSHLVDQALDLFGLPVSVTADVRAFRANSQVDDYFMIRLDYTSHIAVLKASSFVMKEGPRYQIHGKKGSFIKYGIDEQEELLKLGHTPDESDWGVEKEINWGKLYTLDNDHVREEVVRSEHGTYMNFYENIFQAIRNQAELIVKPEQIYLVIRVLELALESNSQKRSILFNTPQNF